MRVERTFLVRKAADRQAVAAISVFAIFCLLLFNSTPKAAEKPKETSDYEYVVTTKDIKKGDIITEDDVEIKDLQMEMTGAYQKKADVIGRSTEEEIKLKELLAKQKRIQRAKKADERFWAQVDERKKEILERWGISERGAGDYSLP